MLVEWTTWLFHSRIYSYVIAIICLFILLYILDQQGLNLIYAQPRTCAFGIFICLFVTHFCQLYFVIWPHTIYFYLLKVGSFLMGWFGMVFKEDISRISSQLAIGLSTGFLGSLTTFSGWNQKMLELSVEGQWVFVVLGYLLGICYFLCWCWYNVINYFFSFLYLACFFRGAIMSFFFLTYYCYATILVGLFLVAYSIIFGIETAKGVNWLYRRANMNSSNSGTDYHWRVDSCKRHLIVILFLLLILASLWGMSIGLEVHEFSSSSPKAQLWLACIVGPFGVWIRWFLARLNGRGLGKSGQLKWVPFGTLIANVSAACVMAALATLKKAVSLLIFLLT